MPALELTTLLKGAGYSVLGQRLVRELDKLISWIEKHKGLTAIAGGGIAVGAVLVAEEFLPLLIAYAAALNPITIGIALVSGAAIGGEFLRQIATKFHCK